MEHEIWKSVNGFIGSYEISNHGNVRSVTRIRSIGNCSQTWKGKSLKPKTRTDGYYCVTLRDCGRVKYAPIHRLVAEHFVDNSENKPGVNHKDLDKLNNHHSNLEWTDQKGNIVHAAKLNAMGHRILKTTDIPVIRQMRASGLSYRKIGEKFGVSLHAIYDIFRNKSWKHVA